jgi:hypothetical protein
MATTRFPAEQNPAVDPELPQPAPPQEVQNPVAAEVPAAGAGRGFVNPPVVVPLADPEPLTVEQSLGPGEQIVVSSPGEVAIAETNVSIQTALNIGQPTAVAQTVEVGGTGGTQGTITRTLTGAQAVDAQTASIPTSTGGNQSTVNIGTNENRGGNLEAATLLRARDEAAVQAEFQSPASGDWRVRLRLAPSATYLYMDSNNALLKPLQESNGVVFPYMPTIQTSYNANYETTELTHSNYRGQFYKSSYVGDIQLTGLFTAQDTAEANYLLAVIHFFRSVTKMFYGARDSFRGAPPPLVYLIGLGQYQFNNQPCVVKTFNYSMPNDCDYIRTKPNNYNVNLNDRNAKPQSGLNPITAVIDRLRNAGLNKGALPIVPAQSLLNLQSVNNINNSTYVPTKCEIQLTLMPIQTRDQESKLFNMQDFANGNLLKGGFW